MNKKMENIASIITILVAFAVLLTLVFGMDYIQDSHKSEQQTIVESAIKRACIQCYSLEGAYPPNVEYLIDEYGVMVDMSRFSIIYSSNGANLMPYIEVMAISEAGR